MLAGRTNRRTVLRTGVGVAGALSVTPGLLGEGLQALARSSHPGRGPYGPPGGSDANGISLPQGFRSRLIARAPLPVTGTAYPWHTFSDAMGTFATGDGGFILTSNSEVPGNLGGASAIRFGAAGTISAAYRILSGTSTNCAGAVTPWGTWLSCEEDDAGSVWECDPSGGKPAVERPAMGIFKHEAGCVDPAGKRLYLTEDQGEAGFYRFTPRAYPDLSQGNLEIAQVLPNGLVRWLPVPDPSAAAKRTLEQVPAATRFRRGEGMWFDDGIVYMTTTSDDRVWAYDPRTTEIEILYDGKALGEKAPLHDVDNLTVSERSGDLFVCEDADDLDICVITPEGEVARFLKLTGSDHNESELTGPVFDPTGQRFFFSSQRTLGLGAIYEVTGPFRTRRPSPGRKPRVSVLGKPTAAGLPRSGLAIRLQFSSRRGPRVPISARLTADLGGKGPLLLAAVEREVATVSRVRLRLRPHKAARRIKAGAIVRLVVKTGSGAARRATSIPIRLD
jgi:uncharacterized protein